ncbi:MAG: diguanylate cyclase [Pseudomonadota bacterium]
MNTASRLQDDAEIMFADEAPAVDPGPAPAPWRVLIVDDDHQVHAITRIALRGVAYRQRALELVSAKSGAEARALLHHPDADFALALVDVVMETPQAGLELVHYIRKDMANRAMRLILRTGQPGHAPEADVIIRYEIDDYKDKTELTAQKLITAVIASLRAYEYVTEIERLNADLEARVAMRTAELERLAMLDPLTGAANRRHLDQRAHAEIERCRRDREALGIVMFDIDHFKRVNDTHGHAAGDHVLCHVVATAKAQLRASDFLARIGGEEFVLLLPGQDLTVSAIVAERIRVALAAHPIHTPCGHVISISSSFGVGDLGEHTQLETALCAADKALYAAKAGGRNRVELAGGC